MKYLTKDLSSLVFIVVMLLIGSAYRQGTPYNVWADIASGFGCLVATVLFYYYLRSVLIDKETN